jgi:hypothetical protein
MKKSFKFLLLLTGIILASALHAQVVVQIDAGSRAPYGDIQSLTIDKKGKCKYLKYDVASHIINDSASFTITPTQLNDFLTKAETEGFFSLKEEYLRGLDGSGIFIAINKDGKKRSVNVKNVEVPQIRTLLAELNTIMQAKKITIDY